MVGPQQLRLSSSPFQQAQSACDLLEPVDARYGGR